MRLLEYVTNKQVFLDIVAEDKETLLRDVTDRLTKNRVIKDSDELLQELLKRESQGGTSLGNGVAIPHARCHNLERIIIAVARLATPIAYDSNDEEPVRIIFLIATPVDKAAEYLKVLAVISKLLKHTDLTRTILNAHSGDDVISAIEAEASAL